MAETRNGRGEDNNRKTERNFNLINNPDYLDLPFNCAAYFVNNPNLEVKYGKRNTSEYSKLVESIHHNPPVHTLVVRLSLGNEKTESTKTPESSPEDFWTEERCVEFSQRLITFFAECFEAVKIVVNSNDDPERSDKTQMNNFLMFVCKATSLIEEKVGKTYFVDTSSHTISPIDFYSNFDNLFEFLSDNQNFLTNLEGLGSDIFVEAVLPIIIREAFDGLSNIKTKTYETFSQFSVAVFDEDISAEEMVEHMKNIFGATKADNWEEMYHFFLEQFRLFNEF